MKKKGTPRQKLDQGRRTDIVELKRKIEQGLHPTDLAMGNDGFIPIVAKFSRFCPRIIPTLGFEKMMRSWVMK